VKATELSISGAHLIESPVFDDGRGIFREWFKSGDLEIDGIDFSVRQANLSHSVRGTVRGLHYSLAPEGQAKIVTCVMGELDDVIVDIRLGSPSFGRVVYVTLDARSGVSLHLPAGVAHGFCVREDFAAMAYLLTSPYDSTTELGISPFDSTLAVPWRLSSEPVLSLRDIEAPSLVERRERQELPIFQG